MTEAVLNYAKNNSNIQYNVNSAGIDIAHKSSLLSHKSASEYSSEEEEQQREKSELKV